MKVRADQIKAALANKHIDDFFLTEVKDGPTHYGSHFRLDALAFKKSWANPAIIGYEIKVSRSDFQRDDKWPAYLALCNQFSFVCPKGLIETDELPQEVGLIYYNPDKGTLYTKRKAMHRMIDEPIDMYKYIMMSKMDSDRHPFFSSKREYFEALVEDKANRRHLGYHVSSKLNQIINDYENQIRELQRRVDRLESDKLFDEEVKEIMKDCGIRVGWGWKEELRTRLSVGVSEFVKREVRNLKQSVERLEELTTTNRDEVST